MIATFEDFEALNIDDVERFSFKNKCFWCRVVKVYDGDSITGIIKFHGSYYKIAIRLNGIDACEIKGSNIILKKKGFLCKERLKELLGFQNENINCMIWIVCDVNDKYGRILADLYKQPEDTIRIQDILIEEKHAYNYSGRTKKTESEQMEYFSIL